MSNKDIENLGFEVFKQYLCTNYGLTEDSIQDVRNGQEGEDRWGCDAIVRYRNKQIPFELKCFGGRRDSNARFCHQTIRSLLERECLSDLRVALTWNLNEGPEKAEMIFFRFGDLPETSVLVEIKFIIQPKRLPEGVLTRDNPLTTESQKTLSLNKVLQKPLGDFL